MKQKVNELFIYNYSFSNYYGDKMSKSDYWLNHLNVKNFLSK